MQCLTILLASVTIWLTCVLAFPFSIRAPSGTHHVYHNALERRTNEPAGEEGEMTFDQFTARMYQIELQILAALTRDPELKARVYSILGISGSELGSELGSEPWYRSHYTEVNNALRRAGYYGELFPERELLLMEEAWEQINRATARDPGILDRLRAAMNLPPEIPWSELKTSYRALNRALRQAGYTGPLLPESYQENRPSGNEEGPRSPDEPSSFSLSGLRSTMTQFKESVIQKLGVVRPMHHHPAGTPSQPAPVLPIKGPLSPFRPIL